MTKKRSIENFSLKINEIFQKLAWKNLNVFDPDSRLPPRDFRPDWCRCCHDFNHHPHDCKHEFPHHYHQHPKTIIVTSSPTSSLARSATFPAYRFSVDNGKAALEGKLLRVTVESLKQSASASKDNVVSAPPTFLHFRQNSRQRFVADAIALDDSQVWRQQSKALGVLLSRIMFTQHIQNLEEQKKSSILFLFRENRSQIAIQNIHHSRD